MALFRYFSSEGGLRVLATCELGVTPPQYINDPLECSPWIKFHDPRGFVRRQIDQITTSPEFFEKNRDVLPVGTFEEFQSGLRRHASQLAERMVAEVPGMDSH